MKPTSIPLPTLALGTLSLLVSTSALAHTGVGSTTGFSAGFTHPIGGMDHLLAMIAVGLWAAQMGSRAVWAVPSAFVSVMVVGGALGISGIHIPYIEAGILVSLLVLGILIALAWRLSLVVSMLLVGLFALFHGHAHGAEMPMVLEGISYSGGFALATALLHLAGIGLGVVLQKWSAEKVTRFAGVAITVSGFYLAFA